MNHRRYGNVLKQLQLFTIVPFTLSELKKEWVFCTTLMPCMVDWAVAAAAHVDELMADGQHPWPAPGVLGDDDDDAAKLQSMVTWCRSAAANFLHR